MPSVQVLLDRAADGTQIDTVMVEEAMIFARDERLEHIRIDLAKREPAL